MDFPPPGFDVVVALGVLLHVADQAAWLGWTLMALARKRGG